VQWSHNADFNGNYANFLKNIKKEYDEAEKYYKKALDIEPNHAIHKENYKKFLSAKKLRNKTIK